MKKFLSLGLMAIVFAAFTFVSCDKEEDNNTETTKTEESGNTTEDKESKQKIQKKLLIYSSYEQNSGGTKYSYVTNYKYNEQGEPIESESKLNGGLYSKSTDYKYDGNIVTYATYSYNYLTGESQGVTYYTKKYKDANRDLLLSLSYEQNSGGTKYSYETNYKYNEQGETIESESKLNGGLYSKSTNYKYDGNVVTYATYSYNYLTGESQGVTNYTEKYTIIELN